MFEQHKAEVQGNNTVHVTSTKDSLSDVSTTQQ